MKYVFINIIKFFLLFKSLDSERFFVFLKEVSYADQDCIYFDQKYSKNINIVLIC